MINELATDCSSPVSLLWIITTPALPKRKHEFLWGRGRQSACVYTWDMQNINVHVWDIKWAVCMDSMWKRGDILCMHRINWLSVYSYIYLSIYIYMYCIYIHNITQCVNVLHMVYLLIAAAHLQRAALILNAQWSTKIICTHRGLPVGVLAPCLHCINPLVSLCLEDIITVVITVR